VFPWLDRLLIWRISKAQIDRQGGTLYKGKYEIEVDPKVIPNALVDPWMKAVKALLPKTFTTEDGKVFIFEDVWVNQKGNVVLKLNVIVNPIPILLILGAVGILAGGLLLWQIVVEIRKILTGSDILSRNVMLIIVGIIVVYFLWKRKKGS